MTMKRKQVRITIVWTLITTSTMRQQWTTLTTAEIFRIPKHMKRNQCVVECTSSKFKPCFFSRPFGRSTRTPTYSSVCLRRDWRQYRHPVVDLNISTSRSVQQLTVPDRDHGGDRGIIWEKLPRPEALVIRRNRITDFPFI